jgi:hypothetical protein
MSDLIQGELKASGQQAFERKSRKKYHYLPALRVKSHKSILRLWKESGI